MRRRTRRLESESWSAFFAAALGLILNGAIFGFFYAWVCSTMWGLDMADPSVAIAAMQVMNASVRNAVFAPAFFGTPVVLLATAWPARIGWESGLRPWLSAARARSIWLAAWC
jgi:uncharacterized membrane protein